MGIFDSFDFNDPNTQGLLSAAAAGFNASGPSLQPRSIGQVLGASLGGYNGAMDRQQQMALSKQKLLNDQLLNQGATIDLQSKITANQEAQRLRDFYTNRATGNPMPQPAQAQQPQIADPMANGKGPTLDNLAALNQNSSQQTQPVPQDQSSQASDNYVRHLSLAQDLEKNGFPAQAAAAYDLAEKFKPKFDRAPHVGVGADGKPFTYILDDAGNKKILSGVLPRDEMKLENLGGKSVAYNPFNLTPGQEFTRTQSPDSKASNALGYARLNFDKTQADTNQDSPLDPLAVRLTAQQYLAGDSTALQNYGRGAQGAKNLNLVRAEITRQANEQGLNGADVAAKMAEFQGIKAGQRTAGTRSANIEIAANEAASLAPLAISASEKVARSGFLPFGKAQVLFDSNTNDPNLRQFAMANNALTNAYAQVMSRGGVGTVSDKEHAKELLSTAFDQPSYAAAVAQLQQEIKAAQTAPKQVRKDISSAVSGRDSGHADTAAPALPKSKIVSIDGGGSASATLGADGKYYVQRGGKTYRVEE